MKNVIVFCLIFLFVSVGMAQNNGKDISLKKTISTSTSKTKMENSKSQETISIKKKIQDLENKIEDLQKQIDGQKSKTRLAFFQISSNPIFNTPFEDFVFASDDMWNNPVDVGLTECSKGCSKSAKRRRDACAKMADGPRKSDCYTASAEAAGRCQTSCQNSFPSKF